MQYTSLRLIVPDVVIQCLNFFESSALKVVVAAPFFNSAEPLQAVQVFLSIDK